jgi:hypothetical protein
MWQTRSGGHCSGSRVVARSASWRSSPRSCWSSRMRRSRSAAWRRSRSVTCAQGAWPSSRKAMIWRISPKLRPTPGRPGRTPAVPGPPGRRRGSRRRCGPAGSGCRSARSSGWPWSRCLPARRAHRCARAPPSLTRTGPEREDDQRFALVIMGGWLSLPGTTHGARTSAGDAVARPILARPSMAANAGLGAARMVASDAAFLAERMGKLDSSTRNGGAR